MYVSCDLIILIEFFCCCYCEYLVLLVQFESVCIDLAKYSGSATLFHTMFFFFFFSDVMFWFHSKKKSLNMTLSLVDHVMRLWSIIVPFFG